MLSTNELKEIVDSKVITRDQSVEFVNNLEEFLNSKDFKERNFKNFIIFYPQLLYNLLDAL